LNEEEGGFDDDPMFSDFGVEDCIIMERFV
jgi:hypothetical protein